jgi:hypothetical protein
MNVVALGVHIVIPVPIMRRAHLSRRTSSMFRSPIRQKVLRPDRRDA